MVSQIFAVIIFITMFACIISGKVERYIPALIGAAAMIIVVFGICMRSTSAIWDTLNLRCFTMLRASQNLLLPELTGQQSCFSLE